MENAIRKASEEMELLEERVGRRKKRRPRPLGNLMIRCKYKVETERKKRTDKGKSRYVGHHEKEVGPLCQKPQSLSVK